MYRLILLLAFLILIACSCRQEAQKNTMPNIIYILADDLGYGDVGAFNPESKIPTPNLDRMAQNGMIFTDAHTSSSVCTPTRYGIITGRYNWRSTLKRSVTRGESKALIKPGRSTVASMLKQKTYHTAFIGKWHLGWDWTFKNMTPAANGKENATGTGPIDFTRPIKNAPLDNGFDYSYGHAASLDMPPYVYVENRMVTQIPDTISHQGGDYGWWRKGPRARDFIHEAVTPHFFGKADEYIAEQAKTEPPFFLYLALPSPHTPILPTEEWKGKSNLNPYGDFVMLVDHYVGLLLKKLESEGIAENTLIIFTSDNGCSPQANFELLVDKGHYPSYHFRGHKADIFEGGHRVPFIVQWPAKIKKGTSSNQLVCTTDLAATLADLTGYQLSDQEGEDSFSMMPLFENPNMPTRPDIIHHSIDGSFAIRKDQWKLIMTGHSGGWSFPRPNRDVSAIDTLPPIQLYNLSKDIAETQNMVHDYPDKVEELKSLLIKYIREGRSTAGNPVPNDGDPAKWPQAAFAFEVDIENQK